MSQRLRRLRRAGHVFTQKYDQRLRQLLVCARPVSTAAEWEVFLHTPVRFGTYLRHNVSVRVPQGKCFGYAVGDRIFGSTGNRSVAIIGAVEVATTHLDLISSHVQQHVVSVVGFWFKGMGAED